MGVGAYIQGRGWGGRLIKSILPYIISAKISNKKLLNYTQTSGDSRGEVTVSWCCGHQIR